MAHRLCSLLLLALLALAQARTFDGVSQNEIPQDDNEDFDHQPLKQSHLDLSKTADTLHKSDQCLSNGLDGAADCFSEAWQSSKKSNLGGIDRLKATLQQTVEPEDDAGDNDESDESGEIDDDDSEDWDESDYEHLEMQDDDGFQNEDADEEDDDNEETEAKSGESEESGESSESGESDESAAVKSGESGESQESESTEEQDPERRHHRGHHHRRHHHGRHHHGRHHHGRHHHGRHHHGRHHHGHHHHERHHHERHHHGHHDRHHHDRHHHGHHHRGHVGHLGVKFAGNWVVSGKTVTVTGSEVIKVGKMSFPIKFTETITVGANSITISESGSLTSRLANATFKGSATISWTKKTAGEVTQILSHLTMSGSNQVTCRGRGGQVINSVGNGAAQANGTAIVLTVAVEEAKGGAFRVASSGDLASESSVVSKSGGKVIGQFSVASLLNWEGTTVAGHAGNFSRISSHGFFGGIGKVNNKETFSVQGTAGAEAAGGPHGGRKREFQLWVAEGRSGRVAVGVAVRAAGRVKGDTIKAIFAAREDVRAKGRGRRGKAFAARVDVRGGEAIQVGQDKGTFSGGAGVRIWVS